MVLCGYVLSLAWLFGSTAAFSIWRTEEGKAAVDAGEGIEPEAGDDLRGDGDERPPVGHHEQDTLRVPNARKRRTPLLRWIVPAVAVAAALTAGCADQRRQDRVSLATTTATPTGKVVFAGSEHRNANAYGVLRLELRPDSYRWEFLTAPGGQVADAGTAACH